MWGRFELLCILAWVHLCPYIAMLVLETTNQTKNLNNPRLFPFKKEQCRTIKKQNQWCDYTCILYSAITKDTGMATQLLFTCVVLGLGLQEDRGYRNTEIGTSKLSVWTDSDLILKGELTATKLYIGFLINYISNSIIWHFKLILCAFLSQDCHWNYQFLWIIQDSGSHWLSIKQLPVELHVSQTAAFRFW